MQKDYVNLAINALAHNGGERFMLQRAARRKKGCVCVCVLQKHVSCGENNRTRSAFGEHFLSAVSKRRGRGA